jgi:hypothetical protein
LTSVRQVLNGNNMVTQYGYDGEQFDSTLGMYYLRARYYRRKPGAFCPRINMRIDAVAGQIRHLPAHTTSTCTQAPTR